MGMHEPLDNCASRMRRVIFKRSDDGTVLDERSYPDYDETLGGPNWQIHRADLHDVLLKKAQSLNIEISMGCKVKTYNANLPAAILEDGTIIEADVIVVADGMHHS